MADLLTNSSNQPLTKSDLDDDLNYLPIDADTLQLQVDTLNVLEGRVSQDSFSEEYQRKILDYYRFSATKMNTSTSKPAPRTTTTLDLL